MKALNEFLKRLRIGSKIGLGYSIIITVSILTLLVSLGTQVLVDRQISRVTNVSATIDQLTDDIAEKITISQIALNENIVQRALVGLTEEAPPKDAQNSLSAIHDDIARLEAAIQGQDDEHLNQLRIELEAFVSDLSTLEIRVAMLVSNLEALGDEESGKQGELLAALKALGEQAQTTGLTNVELISFNALNEARSFLVDGESGHIGRFHADIAQLRALINSSSELTLSEKGQLNSLAEEVLINFDDLVEIQLAFDTSYEAFRDDTAELQASVENIRESGRLNFTASVYAIETAQRLAGYARLAFLFLLLGLVPLTIALALEITRSITRPLSQLVTVTAALSNGNLAARAEISQQDEIGQLAISFNQMADELEASINEIKQAEAEMRQAQAFLHNVLENIPDMIFVKDVDELRFFLLNRATEEILGIDRDEMLGKNDHDLFPVEEADFFTKKDREVLANRTMVDISEETIHTRHQGRRILHTKKVPIFDESDEVIYLLGIAEDITERKQVEEKMKAYAADLERSNQELQSFAFVSSHDLQEPLRKIQTFGDRLQSRYGDSLDEQALDYLRRMQVAAARMQSLIVGLLAYSRVMTRYEPVTQVDLRKIIEGVTSDLEMLLEEVNGRVEVADLHPIEADPTQMRQLFQNLLNNSLKYHQDDVPPIIFVEGEMLDQETYQITVTDNGIGFEEKYAERIFGVFQRLHGRDEYEGTGVGLAICRRIVERHHGEIIARGREGTGAAFIIKLPLKQPPKDSLQNFLYNDNTFTDTPGSATV